MTEEFFERLRERATDNLHSEKFASRYRAEVREYGADRSDVLVYLTIDATIEALKEMMVGEVMKGRLKHGQNTFTNWRQITWVESEYLTDDPLCLRGDIPMGEGHHGTDGEEVVVLVVYL